MKILNISQIDTLFINGSYPIEFLLFYSNKLPTKGIRSAMKEFSGSFWPVYGSYAAGRIKKRTYREMEFFDEENRKEVFDIDQSLIELFEEHRFTNPSEMDNMFHLKIIHYKNGTALIPKMNHLAGDGYSYFYLLSILAAAARNRYLPFKNLFLRYRFKPHHNRTVLKPFSFTGNAMDPSPAIDKPRLELEHIAKYAIRDQIGFIRKEFNQPVSFNDYLCAVVLKKTAQKWSEQFTKGIRLSIPIDIRNQIQEYGPHFFGNGLMFHHIDFEVGEIINIDIKELAMKIRHNMPQISTAEYLLYLENIEQAIINNRTQMLRPYDPENGCLVTNLSRMPTHRLDFGKGKPDLVSLLTVGLHSAAILATDQEFILRYMH